MTGAAFSCARCLCIVVILAPLLASCDRLKGVEQPAPKAADTQASVAPAPAPPKNVPTRLAVALADPAAAPLSGKAAATSIARRISACWVSDQPPDPPVVHVQLGLNQDGSVRTLAILDKARFSADAGYRAAAATATSAFFKCSPFVLEPSSYAGWKSLALLVTPYHD